MSALWRTELRSLGNCFRFREGRLLIGAHLVTTSCIVLLAVVIGRATLGAPPVIQVLAADPSGATARLLIGLVLAIPVLLLGSLGLGQAPRELLEGSNPILLLSSPAPRGVIVLAAVARIVLHGLGFALALGLPLLAPVVARADLAWAALAVFPLALAVAALPVVAASVLAYLTMQRFLSGAVARWVMALALTALGLGAFFLVVSGWSGGDETARVVVELLGSATRLELLSGPADLVAVAAGVPIDAGRAALSCVAYIGVTGLLVAVAARLYPRAFERSLVDDRAGARGVGGAGRWPRGVVRSLLYREWLVLRQQPAHLVFYVLIFVPLLWAARSTALPEVILVPAVAQWAWMLTASGFWMMLVVLSSLLVASLASDDARQLDLLRAAPASRRALLAGRMLGMAFPLLWALTSSAGAAALVTDASALAILLHVAVALPLIALSLGGVAAFGTFCTYVRGADGETTPSAVYVVGGILGQMAVLFGFWYVAAPVRRAVQAWHAGEGPLAGWSPTAVTCLVLGALWIAGLGLGTVGFSIGLRNYRRLLAPER